MRGKRASPRLTVEQGRFDGYRMYLRNQRVRMGYTQEYLAKRCKISREALQKYEAGHRDIPFDVLVRLKKELGAPSFEKLMEPYIYKDGIFVGPLGGEELGIQ